MSMIQADIKARLIRYLDRRQIPSRLEGKGGAMEDEVRALLGAVERNCPRSPDRLGAFWPIFEARLGEIVRGSFWPTEREIKDAAQQAAAEMPKPQLQAGEAASQDPVDIAGKQMSAGLPVAEGWLYGINSCELIARRLVDEATMRAYRSGAFLARKRIYGEDSALRWEADRKAHHEAAKAVYRTRDQERQRHSMTMPDKTAGGTKDFAA